jgi:RHS repeat-associated protein
VYDHNGKLVAERTVKTYRNGNSSVNMISYLHDEIGIIGMVKDNSVYYFHRNMYGDVVGVYNSAGAKVVTFTYDAYGNCTVSGDESLANHCKIRYRGYYFDAETGLYWVQTRYYNPEWCRWISPDEINYIGPTDVHGLNLYCYCYNNPVMFCDDMGRLPRPVMIITSIIEYSAELLHFGLSVSLKLMPELTMDAAKKIARQAGHVASARSYIRARHKSIVETKRLSNRVDKFSKNFGKAVLVADVLWTIGENYASGDPNWVSDSIFDVSLDVGIYALGCIPGVGWILAIGATVVTEIFAEEIEKAKDWFAEQWNEFMRLLGVD